MKYEREVKKRHWMRITYSKQGPRHENEWKMITRLFIFNGYASCSMKMRSYEDNCTNQRPGYDTLSAQAWLVAFDIEQGKRRRPRQPTPSPSGQLGSVALAHKKQPDPKKYTKTHELLHISGMLQLQLKFVTVGCKGPGCCMPGNLYNPLLYFAVHVFYS